MDAEQKAKAAELFKQLDKDNSGFLNLEEVKNGIKQMYTAAEMRLTDADIDKMLKQVDKNNDGKIQITEFLNLL